MERFKTARLRRKRHEKQAVNQGPNLFAYMCDALAGSRKKRRNHNKGFSLVELIIVIAIMAILAAAIAPAVIRYIDKSRKAVDIETGELIFKAAELAYTTANDDTYTGWTVAIDKNCAKTTVTVNGYNKEIDSSTSNTYTIYVTAWCRGTEYKGNHATAENIMFKATLDGKDDPASINQRAYTNEFLYLLMHDQALDEVDHAGERKYDGVSADFLKFRYKKAVTNDKLPECWLLCIRGDTKTPEVWIGDKNFNGRGSPASVHPLYRIYPDPCQAYME